MALGTALALPGSAQSIAEQLQKAIYAQQTAGDLDGAIQTYRQIVASNPAQRIYAAQAQMHLAQALLQKGDLPGAAQEFTPLSANYSEFRDMIAGMAGRMAGVEHGRVFSLGTVTPLEGEPTHYQHNLTGVELTMPSGWKLEGDSGSSGGGDMVLLSSSNLQTDILAVWLKPGTGDGANLDKQLRASLARKGEDRVGVEGWKVRPESVQMRVVAGQQALSAVADYSETAGQATVQNGGGEVSLKTANTPVKMVEYMIWVQSAKSKAFFFGRANAADLAALQSGIDQLASMAVIP